MIALLPFILVITLIVTLVLWLPEPHIGRHPKFCKVH